MIFIWSDELRDASASLINGAPGEIAALLRQLPSGFRALPLRRSPYLSYRYAIRHLDPG